MKNIKNRVSAEVFHGRRPGTTGTVKTTIAAVTSLIAVDVELSLLPET